MPDPLPCPFCGTAPETRQFTRRTLVGCSDGDCPGFDIWTSSDRWNRRAVEPTLAELVRAADAWHLDVEFPTLSREVLALSKAIDALPVDLLEACGVKRG